MEQGADSTRPLDVRSWNPVQNSPPAVDAALSDLQVLLLDQATEVQKKSSEPPEKTGLKQEHQLFLEQHYVRVVICLGRSVHTP
jgi:hypothetical protein